MPKSPDISIERIAQAREHIDPVFLNTPQFENNLLSQWVGTSVIVKVECLNPVRSFKGRGACYYTHLLKDTAPQPWICASAGNFGQGLVYAANKHKIPVLVYASVNANSFKISQMRALGAEVRLIGNDFDDAKEAGREYADLKGLTFIEDGRDTPITEGAGTIATELLEWPEPLAAVIIPVGNGALINGVGTWIKSHSPETLVIGAGAEGAPAMEYSFRTQNVRSSETISTFADGIATRIPVPEAIATMTNVVDDMYLVNDQLIYQAVDIIEESLGIKVEGAGAVSLAVAKAFSNKFIGKRIALVISGNNVSKG